MVCCSAAFGTFATFDTAHMAWEPQSSRPAGPTKDALLGPPVERLE